MIKDFSVELLLKASTVWFDIKPLALYSLEGEPVTYPSDDRKPNPNNPTLEEVRYILFEFQEEGAIKIRHELGFGRRNVPYKWLFDVDKPRFRELEGEIKNLYLSKSEELLKEEGISLEGRRWVIQKKQAEWSDEFIWKDKTFIFGQYGNIPFTSDIRKALFELLTNGKGNWVSIQKLKGSTNANYVRSTISQIEKRLTHMLNNYVCIPSTRGDNLEPKPSSGAYRIKFTSKPPKQPKKP